MGRRSKIEQMDKRIKAEVDRLIREGRHTIDDILEHLQQLGEEDVTRSSVGRYVHKRTAQFERFREAQEVAAVWGKQLADNPDDDLGRLVTELLRVISFQTIADLNEEDAEVNPRDVMLLSKAIKDLATADKTSADREIKVRREIAAKAEQAAEEIVAEAREAGLSDDGARAWREKILGLADKS